jgi:hypothetical protein
MLEVATDFKSIYEDKKEEDPDYQIPLVSYNERPGLQRITYSAIVDSLNAKKTV